MYRRLHKTIEKIVSRHFESVHEMLEAVIIELIRDTQIDITGGRIWRLAPENAAYELLYQTGKMDKIAKNFRVFIKDYPLFDRFVNDRTILGNETNEILRRKGIFKYSATGVGNRIKLSTGIYYEYLIAFNSANLNYDTKYLFNIIGSVLTSKIKQSQSARTEKNLKAELDKARQLQKTILPQHEYVFGSYEMYGVTIPAEIVGGDFFDYLEIGDDKDRIGVAIGDAASKGVSAAAEAMYISGALRMASTFEIKIPVLMKRMNQLVNRIFGDDKFSSLFYGELSNEQRGLFLYANAGHNPPIFYKKSTGLIQYLDPTGPVLGPVPKASYTIESVNFEPGDVLLLYSDGLIESSDSNSEAFGEEKLESAYRKVISESSKIICLSVLESVLKFSKKGGYNDDKTVVVIKRK
ncbi:MAG: serine/threonine-protein phosphatase [Ignavibacteriaceae bacterium]|nr:serine/threonine-protein phosphatase [Ignavibacteriaceae bacterium]